MITDLRFRCGRPAIGKTAILMGTKDGVPLREEEVKVCEDCYAVPKQKVKTRTIFSDLRLS